MVQIETDDIVGAIVVDKYGKHLLVKGTTEKWSFPKGRRLEGETPYEAALREAREEAGIDLSEEKDFTILQLKYGTYYFFKLKSSYTKIVLQNPSTPEEILRVSWKKRRIIKNMDFEMKNADLRFYFNRNYAFRRPRLQPSATPLTPTD